RAVAGLLLLFALVALAPCPAFANDAPAWMHALTSVPLPPHDEKTDAVLLYSEEILIVQPDGKLKRIHRRAYKILRPSGKEHGKQVFTFNNDRRITNIRGWCIPAQGKDFEVKDKDLTERGYTDVEGGELISDVRAKVMNIPAPDPGNLIGYEVEHDIRPYILQDEWFFQDEIPVAESRYTLQLPSGWEYKAVWINHPELPPVPVGSNQWQWVVKNVPEVKDEQFMPPWKGVAGVMVVSLIPPSGAKGGFLTWSEMGSWYKGLTQNRLDASPAIKQKVAELTANRPTAFGKMVALAEFMQKDIRYVAITLGIGGLQPHSADETFSHRYGDCKDKATLLSSMLREVGIDSYFVVINHERGGVTPLTPPHIGAFDHVVLAIHLPDSVNDPSLAAVNQHPKLGRLLFFDPTDEVTPIGQLYGSLQSNYALMVTPDGGELTQLPQLNTSGNGTTRVAKLTLDLRGTLSGNVHETRVGDSASHQRWTLRYVEKDADRIKPIETMMSRSMGNFQITKASISNLKQNSLPFGYDWSFVAPAYGKTAGDLLLVRPRVIGSYASGVLETKEPRKYPVEFEGPRRDADDFEIKLPPGYAVDELPPPIDVEYSFGSYHSKTEADGDTIRYTRTVEIKELSVPVSKADDLKKFYRIIASDERNTAVLKPVAH
ncbi:MAG TPA: DUF3857 and transglutaminase domain-containing protein, partial [Candidatus Acidoferrum sp.]|nr:DUF3857 and transglutaminase domain-containing protein [Candidatus Acidoferrum sp.]